MGRWKRGAREIKRRGKRRRFEIRGQRFDRGGRGNGPGLSLGGGLEHAGEEYFGWSSENHEVFY
jgi:hypothetical protein